MLHLPDFIIGPGSSKEERVRYLSEIYHICEMCNERIHGPLVSNAHAKGFVCKPCSIRSKFHV